MSGAIPDYIGMGQQASEAGFKEAQTIGNQLSQGFSLGTKMRDRSRQDQARKVFGDAWASGDPKAIEQAMQLFPEYAEQAQKFIGIRDDQHRKDAGSLMMKINALAGTGDAQGIIDAVNGSGDILDASAKQQLIKQAQLMSDPQNGAAAKDFLDRYTKGMAVSALSPLEAINYGTDQQKLALQAQQIQNQLTLGEGQLALGQGQLGLGYQRLSEMMRFHDEMHQDRLAALDAKNAQDSFTNLITPDGVPHKVRMNPKTGAYANHDTKGNPIDVDGKVLNLTGNAGMQSGGADALRALNSANTLSNDPALKGSGGNSYPARVYKSIDPTGSYHDLQAKFDTVNKAVAAAIAVRLTQESGGFAPKQGEIEAGIKSAGELSLNNSAEQNRAILKRQKEILHNVVENANKSEQSRVTGTAEEQAHVTGNDGGKRTVKFGDLMP